VHCSLLGTTKSRNEEMRNKKQKWRNEKWKRGNEIKLGKAHVH